MIRAVGVLVVVILGCSPGCSSVGKGASPDAGSGAGGARVDGAAGTGVDAPGGLGGAGGQSGAGGATGQGGAGGAAAVILFRGGIGTVGRPSGSSSPTAKLVRSYIATPAMKVCGTTACLQSGGIQP
jgi:hypothetical protein